MYTFHFILFKSLSTVLWRLKIQKCFILYIGTGINDTILRLKHIAKYLHNNNNNNNKK